MPSYRVGVSLNLRGNYGRGLTGAASQTERFRGVVARTAGSATADLRRTAAAAAGVGDVVGRTARRSTSGLRSISAAAAGVRGAFDRAAGGARRVGTAARRMADTTSAALGRTRRRVNDLIGRFRVLERTAGSAAAGGVLSGGVGRLAGYAGGGFAVARAGQQAASMDTLIRRLSRESDRSMGELTGIRDRAYDVGADRGVNASELMQAVVAAQAAGGVQIQERDLKSLAVIMQRAGVGGAEAGNVWARMAVLPGDTRENVATLAMGADAGELTFREALGQITRMVASVRTWATDETAVPQMVALMNAARAGSASPDEMSAAMDTLTREAVMRAEDIKKVFGVDVLSATPGREGFLREDFVSGAVMEIADSARAWGGEARLLEAFGADALRALKVLLTEEGRDKSRGDLARRGEWSPFVADADVVAEGIEARGIAMMQKVESAFTRTITGPMQGAFTLMQAHQTELMVAAVAVSTGANILSRFRLRRTIAEGARTQTVTTSTVATMRVGTLVVGSMPAGGGRAGPKGTPGVVLGPDGKPVQPRQQPRGGGTVARTAGGTGRLAGWGRRIPYAGTAIAGLSVLPALASGDTRNVVQSTAGLAGGWGGAVAGAKAGGLLGAFLGPPGAAIGSIIGGLLGGAGGWWAGERAAGGLLDRDAAAEDERAGPQHPRLRRRRQDLVGRTAGVELATSPAEDVAAEDERAGPQHPRLRRRRQDLVGRTAGVELATSPAEDVAAEDERAGPQHPRLRRRRRAPAEATTNHYYDDRSTVTVNVQGADDPARTAEMVADEIERRQRRRDRRIRDTLLEDPEPDPEF